MNAFSNLKYLKNYTNVIKKDSYNENGKRVGIGFQILTEEKTVKLDVQTCQTHYLVTEYDERGIEVFKNVKFQGKELSKLVKSILK